MTDDAADQRTRFMAIASGLPATALGLPGRERDALTRLALSGTKTSTTSLLDDYEREHEPVPAAGSRYQLLDSTNRPVAIIEVTTVRISRFDEVDLEHAWAEGEGFETIEDWREAHVASWPHIRAHTMVVLERFRVVDRASTSRLPC